MFDSPRGYFQAPLCGSLFAHSAPKSFEHCGFSVSVGSTDLKWVPYWGNFDHRKLPQVDPPCVVLFEPQHPFTQSSCFGLSVSLHNDEMIGIEKKHRLLPWWVGLGFPKHSSHLRNFIKFRKVLHASEQTIGPIT